jgi:hypothetical protein
VIWYCFSSERQLSVLWCQSANVLRWHMGFCRGSPVEQWHVGTLLKFCINLFWIWFPTSGTASVGAVENLMRRWELVLQTCNHVTALLGLPNYKMQERMLVHVRRMLLRTGPSLREVGFLHGFLTMVERIASKIQVSQEQQKSSSCKVDTWSAGKKVIEILHPF